jgi:hypothetical protein
MEARIMKISKNDLGVLRSSLITLAVAASCSLLLIFISEKQSELAGKDWREAQRQLRSAQSELSNAKQDQGNMDSYLAEYTASVSQHLIGEEARLDWVESLGKLHQQKLIADFRYNIGPQKLYTAQPAIDSGNFNIHYSEMKLQLDMLHEVQLLEFFDALRGQIKGWYQLAGCSIVRNSGDPQNTGIQLKAECTGGWITLKNRSAPQ